MKPEFTLNIGIPNGLILTGIGILLLLTPVFYRLDSRSTVIDVVAGIVLVTVGLSSLIYGLKNRNRESEE